MTQIRSSAVWTVVSLTCPRKRGHGTSSRGRAMYAAIPDSPAAQQLFASVDVSRYWISSFELVGDQLSLDPTMNSIVGSRPRRKMS